MPCSYCHDADHNIQRCELLTLERARSIYNDGIDKGPRNVLNKDQDQWFLNRETHKVPSDREWCFSTRGGERYSNYVYNVLVLLKKIRKFHLEYNETNPQTINYEIVRFGNSINKRYHKIHVDSATNKLIVEDLTYHDGTRAYNQFERERKELLRRLANEEHERLRAQNRENQEAQRRAELEQRRQRTAQQAMRNAEELERRISTLANREDPIEATECPVCMDELKTTNHMVLRCGHQYCGDCIFRHFQKNGGTKCPMCRSDYALRVEGWVPPNTNTTPNARRRPVQTQSTRENNIQNRRLGNIENMLSHLMGLGVGVTPHGVM